MPKQHILIIKLGALGDVVQAFGPVKAIRQYHPDAQITVLTTKPYAGMFGCCPDVDNVWVDMRPKWYQLRQWYALKRQLCSLPFDRVYDLQTSDRSSVYRKLLSGIYPEWSGIAKGCSHPHANPRRDFMHTLDRQAEQLRMAGIDETPFPQIEWLKSDVSHFGLPKDFMILVPGGAPHRPQKRWPVYHFANLADLAIKSGITPVILGTQLEKDEINAIIKEVPEAISLCGKTDFADIATLGRMAKAAVGNDTGPMHMLAVAGCPSVSVYSAESDPELCAQRGPNVVILRNNSLINLPVEEVWQKLTEIGGFPSITG